MGALGRAKPGSRSPRITGIAFSIKLLDLIAQTGTFAYIAHVGSSYVDNPEQPVTMRLTSHTIRGEESCYRERESSIMVHGSWLRHLANFPHTR